MKFEFAGFPFEVGPVLSLSPCPSPTTFTSTLRVSDIMNTCTVFSLLSVQWYQPACSPQPHPSVVLISWSFKELLFPYLTCPLGPTLRATFS